MSTLSDLIDPSLAAVGVAAASREEATAAALALLDGHPGVLDAAQLAADVAAREQVLSTGVGAGLALPHARTSSVSATVAALVTLAAPVDWAAIDGSPVEVVLLFAGPEDERAAHVRLLARISRVLSRAGTREALAAARTPEEAVAAVS